MLPLSTGSEVLATSCPLSVISLRPLTYPILVNAATTEADRTFRYEPLQLFEHVEHGKEADPTFKDLLKPGSNLADLTASIGAEVTGVQLTSLDNTGKDQLALLAAQKKVVGERCSLALAD